MPVIPCMQGKPRQEPTKSCSPQEAVQQCAWFQVRSIPSAAFGSVGVEQVTPSCHLSRGNLKLSLSCRGT